MDLVCSFVRLSPRLFIRLSVPYGLLTPERKSVEKPKSARTYTPEQVQPACQLSLENVRGQGRKRSKNIQKMPHISSKRLLIAAANGLTHGTPSAAIIGHHTMQKSDL